MKTSIFVLLTVLLISVTPAVAENKKLSWLCRKGFVGWFWHGELYPKCSKNAIVSKQGSIFGLYTQKPRETK
ncbi:hypothetical protein [Tolypothrix sp. VBCCA 56010]|uniref:hypothetical protein n=1 Tax=Tolypothrix sp. VBCCA 56010 TaxID=3137731 RepID=UPI003D7D6078